MGEESAAATVAALYLVAYEYGAVSAACRLQFLRELRGGKTYAAHSLYALQYHSCDIILCQFAFPCRDVIERQISHMPVGIDRSDNLWIVGSLYCQ